MNLFKRFLLLCLCAIPTFAQGQIATTAGSNLTAWNGNSGATNNNNWNQMMNNRTMAGGGGGATADFGNCNSLILRCAQPKCAGCNTLDLARPIVAGCVNSNAACKKYGDDLIEFISAQLVSNATNKAQQAQIAAQTAAAQAAVAQSNAQLQQMQTQMQQMQYEMQQQNVQQMARMQAALDEQKALTAAAMEQATKQPEVSAPVSSANAALTDEMVAAAERGIDADILARKQISGQILSKIENAEIALKKLKATMDTAFVYAGCDARGNNCAGPKRVKIFKEKALAFFEPYDEIVDEAYEALEMALAVGVDVSDVIMMLSGACNQWGKFLCTGDDGKHEVEHYNAYNCNHGRSVKFGTVKGGQECTPGMAVPPQDDNRCTVTQLIGDTGDNEEVLREWLDENYEGDRLVRVGCATSALESIAIFGRRNSKRGATLDLDTLERIILQDAPDYIGTNRYSQGPSDEEIDRLKYCALTPTGYQNLLTAVQSKKLPKKICVSNEQLAHDAKYKGWVKFIDETGLSADMHLLPWDKEACEPKSSHGTYVKNRGCSMSWNEDSERCMLDVDCVYVGGVVWKKSDWDAAEKTRQESDNSAKMNIEENQKRLEENQKRVEWCYERKGRLNDKWQCLCGDVIMAHDSYTCKDEKIVNKK
ncbi:MAG: hypothetical protein R8M70_04785 [Alphaproteobacteria bacterium]|nr:hypothetical protein [Alphaproteobacteria bacterium]